MTASPTSRQIGGESIALFLAAIALVGVAFYERNETNKMRVELGELNLASAADTQGLKLATRRTVASEEKLAALKENLSRLATSEADAHAAPGRINTFHLPSLAEQKVAGQKFLNAFPQARALIRTIGKAQYDAIADGFFRTAGLTAQQVEQLEKATMDTWEASIAVTPNGGIHPTETSPSDDTVRSIIGDQGLQQLKDYTRAVGAHNFTLQVATGAGMASEPLSSAQTDQLAQIVTANSASYQGGKTVALPQVDWSAVQTQASGQLSPAQMQSVQRSILTIQYQQALNLARQNALNK